MSCPPLTTGSYPFPMFEKIDFNVGDVVMLRSGGPKMTISHIAAGLCFCEWFDKNRHRSGDFQPAVLFRPRKPNA